MMTEIHQAKAKAYYFEKVHSLNHRCSVGKHLVHKSTLRWSLAASVVPLGVIFPPFKLYSALLPFPLRAGQDHRAVQDVMQDGDSEARQHTEQAAQPAPVHTKAVESQ